MSEKFDIKTFKKGIENENNFQLVSVEFCQQTSNKEFTKPFLQQVTETLQDKKEKGIHKFFCLRLLRDCIGTCKGAIVNDLANSKQLLNTLKEYALYNCSVQDDDRGATIFEKTDPIIGNQFLRLILECIYIWADKFKKDSKGNPTKFKTIYDELKDQKVKFPSEFYFFPKPPELTNQQQQEEALKQSSKILNQPLQQTQFPSQAPLDPKEIKRQFNKLIPAVLEDATSIEETIKDVHEPEEFIQEILESYYKTFMENLKTAERLDSYVKDPQFGFIKAEQTKFQQILDFIQLYIFQFKDLQSSGFLESTYKSFQSQLLDEIAVLMQKKPPNQKLPPKQEPRVEQTPQQRPETQKNEDVNKPDSKQNNQIQTPQAPPPQRKYDQDSQEMRQANVPTFGTVSDNLRSINQAIRNQPISQTSSQVQPSSQQFYRKDQQRPPSPLRPVQQNYPEIYQAQVKQPVNYQKQTPIQSNPVPISVQAQQARKGYQEEFPEQFDALSMSTMSVRDFPMKNRELQNEKQHHGSLIPFDTSNFNFLYDMGLNDNQIRRLKVASLKSKAAIFESPQVQIGVNSKLIYHNITNKYFLRLQLVFGNKTQDTMFNCKTSFEGDYAQSLWVKPLLNLKNQSNNAETRNQIIQEVMVYYNQIPFQPITGQFIWEDQQNQMKANFVLPTFLPKFMRFLDIDYTVFKQKWHLKRSQIMKSEVVPINPKIIRQPIFFKRYFPEIIELSSLSDFINQTDGMNDFKLGGIFTLQSPQIEFMLKIIVKPNLSGIFKIIPFLSYQSQAEHILHNLIYIFGLPI